MPRFAQDYRPLYFLAALGNGGLSVSFFMYLMFLIPHPDTPIPTFESLVNVYAHEGLGLQAMTTVALIGVAWFSVRHFLVLAANLRALGEFRRSPGYAKFLQGNGEVTLMAVPLTLAMTVNVLFILGALGVPGLWNVVEIAFPFALLAFGAVAALAVFYFGRYLARVIAHSGFDIEDTNHFSQLLPAFAFSMIAVGFGASAAMSKVMLTSVLGMVGGLLFLVATAAWILVKLPVSFAAILRKGLALEAGPSLWMGIPILTLVGITFVRVGSGISHNLLGTDLPPVLAFIVLTLLVSGQVLMGAIGWAVMRKQGYFARSVWGKDGSVPSYGLVCPGVAAAVLGMFFIHWGFVKTDIIALWSVPHIALLLVVVALQARTIQVLRRLDGKLFGKQPVRDEAPAPVLETV